MPIPKSIPVHQYHPTQELGAIFIGAKGTAHAFITPNFGKTVTKVLLPDFRTAFNFLDKIEPLND